MKRNLHNLNFGFIQLKRNVHFDSTDHDCPKNHHDQNEHQITQRHQSRKIPRRVINTHAEVRIPRTEFGARAISSSQGNYRTTFYPAQLRTKVNKHENKQTMDNISTNVTSVLRGHVSDRKQPHSGRLASFDVSIAVIHWRWYQVMVIGQQAQHVQCRQRSVTYRVKCLHSAEYPGRSCP